MKKLLSFIFASVLMLGMSFAQPKEGGDPAARMQKEIDGLTTALSLSKDQVAKVTTILKTSQKEQGEAFKKMREGGEVDRSKMQQERKKMQTETDKKIKAVITPAQATKLDTFRKEQASKMANRKPKK